MSYVGLPYSPKNYYPERYFPMGGIIVLPSSIRPSGGWKRKRQEEIIRREDDEVMELIMRVFTGGSWLH